MKTLTHTIRFPFQAVVATLLLLSMTSCNWEPRQKLIGRWYSSDVSIRFREDGSVYFNSPAGLGVGRFHFDETVRSASTQDHTPNLVLDLIRKQNRIQLRFNVQIMSPERIRLTEILPPAPGQSTAEPVIGRLKLLKRAHDQSSSRPSNLAAIPQTH